MIRERGRTRILLPPIGFNGGVLFLALFGLAFGGSAAAAALRLLGDVRVNSEIPTEPVWGLALMGGIFALIGLAILLAPLIGAAASEWIEDARGSLIVGYRGWGMSGGVRTLPKREIESIDLSAAPNTPARVRYHGLGKARSPAEDAPRDLRIRTAARVLRIGRHLSPEELRWLTQRVEVMARG